MLSGSHGMATMMGTMMVAIATSESKTTGTFKTFALRNTANKKNMKAVTAKVTRPKPKPMMKDYFDGDGLFGKIFCSIMEPPQS